MARAQGLLKRGQHDLVELGGGTAGIVASTYAAALGARVALVEQGRPGGDCLWTGCVPSKALIAAATTAQAMRGASRLGIDSLEPGVDFPRVMDHVHGAMERARVPDTPEALGRRGVEVIRARGRFTGPGCIEAEGRELSYRAAIVATGASAALAAPGHLTTDSVWELPALPARLLVLGGGPTGIELAQAFSRLGSEVTIVERAGRLLPGLDPEVGGLLAEVLAEEGVRVRVGEDGDSASEGRQILAVTGRRPATAGLGLESVGVQTDGDGWIRADARMRTMGERIWAAGDVLGGLQFTHVAGHQGATAALNALLRARRTFNPHAVPRVVFSDPEIVTVGLSEAEAQAQLGRAPVVLRHDYAHSDRAITDARARGFAKLVCDRRGRLLGATVVAPHASESGALLGSLVARRAKAAELSQIVFPYPTYSEGVARAAESWWASQ